GTENEKLIIANGAGNGKFRNGAVIEGISASSITAADVDGDGNVDLITSKFVMRRAAGGEMLGGAKLADDKVTVYWGEKGRFAPANSLVLDVSYTASTAVADIDGDGIRDIVCAVHQGERTYAAESPIFYGKGGRRFERGENGIPSEGASHAAVITDSPNSAATVVISNSRTGTLNEAVPLVLYYGSKDGFKARKPLRIPFASGYES